MKITYKGDYALKAILDLALHYAGELVTIHEIAKRIDAPVKFLEQVLLDLKKGGFVESRRGNIGGYLLSKPPAKITVGEVVRFIDGPIEPISCARAGYSDCGDLYKCIFRKIWQDVSKATSYIIDNVTFEELAARVSSGQQALAYSI
ncbi:MAG: Rrf2 family transcriptional regulator [Candidatus Omnitrophota bacterium]|nr:Rrf2 family transcriptional regulator [Candidatus Omnitrophota bacterium]